MRFSWLRQLFRTPSPLDPEHRRRLPRGLEFTVYEPAELPAIQALYAVNDDGRLPAGFQPAWEREWNRGNSLRLVCRRDGEVVGCCGVGYQRVPAGHFAMLSFGLVRPDLQRQGIGTAQLLVRLAQLAAPAPQLSVVLEAVRTSEAYYARFGFHHLCYFQDPVSSRPIQLMMRRMAPDLPGRARRALSEGGIRFPWVPNQVPTVNAAENEAELGWDERKPVVKLGKAPGPPPARRGSAPRA